MSCEGPSCEGLPVCEIVKERDFVRIIRVIRTRDLINAVCRVEVGLKPLSSFSSHVVQV